MVNEEIITALRNAVEHGESLQDSMQIMMNSGYSPAEVQEASRYVGGGTLHMHQPNPDEHLTMPSQKSGISNMAFWKKEQKPQISQQISQNQNLQQNQIQAQKQQIQQPQQTQQYEMQSYPQLQQYPQIQSSTPLTKQLDKIGPPRRNYLKEIILLVILLVLIGVLAVTILFKDKILAWFA